MFFYLSKIFGLLLFPLPLFAIAAVAALFAMRRGWIRRGYSLALALLLLFSSGPGSNLLLHSLEDRYDYCRTMPWIEAKEQFDGAIVLGGMINPLASDGERPEFMEGVDRILIAEELLREGVVEQILISGGDGMLNQRSGRAEADELRHWLLGRGWSEEQIIAESSSRTTLENARYTYELLDELQWRRVVLITSAFHMPRSLMTFRLVAGDGPHSAIEWVPCPVDRRGNRLGGGIESLPPTPLALFNATIAFKEYIGIVAYWLFGRAIEIEVDKSSTSSHSSKDEKAYSRQKLL